MPNETIQDKKFLIPLIIQKNTGRNLIESYPQVSVVNRTETTMKISVSFQRQV